MPPLSHNTLLESHDPLQFDDLVATQAERIFVNCWHSSSYESAIMWEHHAGKECGVAIKSTVGRLRRSLIIDVMRPIQIKDVVYIDYDTDDPEPRNTFELYFFKLKHWEQESEIRAVLSHYLLEHSPGYDRSKFAHGDDIDIDLDTLIEEVYTCLLYTSPSPRD